MVNPDDTQSLYFYNKPVGGVEIIKTDADHPEVRIPNVTFEVRRMDDGLVDTITTDANGRVFLTLEDGDYYVVETKAADGYKLDDTPHYFTVKDGKPSKLPVSNKSFSGILIHKISSTTGKGIPGVSFLLYGTAEIIRRQYTSDQNGYVYIDNLPSGGRYYLRELDNEGYIPDTQLKTVYVTAGKTTEIIWKNTPITAQIQIIKKSADDNPTNGRPPGHCWKEQCLKSTTRPGTWWIPFAATAGAVRFPSSSRCPGTPSGRSRPQRTTEFLKMC